jgi:molybdopterin-guanine dinucleotide biosynthesis protein A
MPPDAGREVAAVLLAGGLARRMGGGDKCLRTLGSKPLLEHVVARVGPQVTAMVLNANGDPTRFAGFNLPILPDVVADFPGPLAGVLTGLEWARSHLTTCSWLLSVPTDAPFLPLDLVARLKAAVSGGARLACAASAGQSHPVVGLWPIDIAEDLRGALVDEGVRKIDAFTARYPLATVQWPTDPLDPFFNANRPDDLAEAERLMAR